MGQQQRDAIEYLREENRVLREQPGGRRLRLNDEQRRRLAIRGKTIARLHRKLIAAKYDGCKHRGPCRPRSRDQIRELVVQMATESRDWGYRRIQVRWTTWVMWSHAALLRRSSRIMA